MCHFFPFWHFDNYTDWPKAKQWTVYSQDVRPETQTYFYTHCPETVKIFRQVMVRKAGITWMSLVEMSKTIVS